MSAEETVGFRLVGALAENPFLCRQRYHTGVKESLAEDDDVLVFPRGNNPVAKEQTPGRVQ